MSRPKGIPKTGGGSRKGIPNKVTADLKGTIMQALSNAGGVGYLARVAEQEPKVFCSLLAKILPTQVTGKEDAPLSLEALVLRSIAPDRT